MLDTCMHVQVTKVIANDTLGCNAVSWAPCSAVGSQLEDSAVLRLVTGTASEIYKILNTLFSRIDGGVHNTKNLYLTFHH